MTLALNTVPLRVEKGEGPIVVPVGQERTIFDKAGPGVVETLWMAVGGETCNSLDGRIKIYYDGSNQPQCDIDIGTLFATHWQASGVHNTPHMSAQCGGSPFYDVGFQIGFPMPFGQRIRITYTNPHGSWHEGYIYWMVAHRLYDHGETKRLRCWGKRYRDQLQTRSAGATTEFCDIRGAGSLVWMSLVGGVDTSGPGGNRLSWLERNIYAYIDGEADASVKSSGTEDWFDSAWYYHGRNDVPTSVHGYVGTERPPPQPNCVGQAVDLLSKWGGIPFTSRCVIKALPEPACTTGDKFTYAILYYQ